MGKLAVVDKQEFLIEGLGEKNYPFYILKQYKQRSPWLISRSVESPPTLLECRRPAPASRALVAQAPRAALSLQDRGRRERLRHRDDRYVQRERKMRFRRRLGSLRAI